MKSQSIATIYKDAEQRDNLGLKATKTYYGNVESMYIEDGFNIREQLDQDHIDSIAEAYRNGKYVPAIVVQPTERGLKIVDGHHRYLAALQAEVDKVELKNFTGDEVDAVAFMVTSSQGRNLTPVERGKAYQRMIDSGMTPKQIAEKLGRSDKDVKNHLTLINSSEKIITAVSEGKLGYAAAVEEIHRNGDEGVSNIESKLDGNVKVTRSTLAGFTKKDHNRVMGILSDMEFYDESWPQELMDLVTKYKESK